MGQADARHAEMMEETMTRRERERLMRREAMVEAALTVFAEKGYAGATIDEIAQRAEFGKGTIYNYFPDGKEGMLVAIFDEIYGRILALIEDAFTRDADGRSVHERMKQFIRTSLELFDVQRDVFLIVTKEVYRMMLSEDPALSRYFQRQHQRVVDALIPHLRRAMDRGEMRPMDPEAVAHTLFGNINGIQLHLCLSRDVRGGKTSLTAEAAAEFINALLMHGLLEPDAGTTESDE